MKEPSCTCCANNNEFDFPAHLLTDCLNGEVAIFAGSGISTESKLVLPQTFYDWIAYDVKTKKRSLTFSELMEEYCKQPNGRSMLFSEIKDRLDNIRSFPELYRNATRFHRELSTLPQIKTIITTNWDTYFEDECGARPFLYPEDFAFWNTNERKVIKIHGSIQNCGSIVATKTDYKKCLEKLQKGIAGSVLKTILATKTVIYIGYSFSDEDFQQIHKFLRKEMKTFSRQAYIVTLDEKNIQRYRNMHLEPIFTDGTYFLQKLKKHSVSNNKSLPDDIYDFADSMRKVFVRAHNQLHREYTCVKNPEMIFCAFYQDGAIHAFERILSLKNTGRYSCNCEFIRTIETYKKIRKDKLAMRQYGDVAYIDGYWSAHLHLFLFFQDKMKIPPQPLFYAYGLKEDIVTLKDYKKVLRRIPNCHKAAYSYAKKVVKLSYKGGQCIIHHPAYL